MIERAREDASTILEGDIKHYSLLERELSQIQSDAAAEYIDKS
jgi:ATP-dependent DNA helicase RecG